MWVGKLTGYSINEKFAAIHFSTFLIAINIVFFPMVRPVRVLNISDPLESVPFVSNNILLLGIFRTLVTLLSNKWELIIASVQWMKLEGLSLSKLHLRIRFIA